MPISLVNGETVSNAFFLFFHYITKLITINYLKLISIEWLEHAKNYFNKHSEVSLDKVITEKLG